MNFSSFVAHFIPARFKKSQVRNSKFSIYGLIKVGGDSITYRGLRSPSEKKVGVLEYETKLNLIVGL